MTTEPRASLVERLRRRATCTDSGGMGFFSQYDSHLLREAADEIARLEALRTQGDGAYQALVMARELLMCVEQTTGNLWWVNADDPETAVGDTFSAIEDALASPTQASSREEG